VFGVVLSLFKTGYLFEDFEDGPIKKRSKFDRLVTALKEIYDELPVSKEEKEEYKLFISGHSLGGALCNLFAFGLAETQQGHPLFNRVTAVSFASPVVGTKGYNKAFQVSALFGSGGSNGMECPCEFGNVISLITIVHSFCYLFLETTFTRSSKKRAFSVTFASRTMAILSRRSLFPVTLRMVSMCTFMTRRKTF
jgi:hypothetical protein